MNPCSGEAVAIYIGLTTRHPVCLAHAQRHRSLAWPGTFIEWIVEPFQARHRSPLSMHAGARGP